MYSWKRYRFSSSAPCLRTIASTYSRNQRMVVGEDNEDKRGGGAFRCPIKKGLV